MALSAAMQWALANGLSEADVYKNINDFLATNPDAATTQAQMAQYGISPEDVAVATGGKSGGLLSGNIMAGASWNSTNTALQDALTQATGQQTSNYAVGGSTTTDTLNQLNTFLAGGGQFDPNATVYLQAGGVDFIQGVDKAVVKDNLNQIVKTLGDQGVNVVLTGSPYATSVQDVIDNKFNPEVDQIYKDVAKANSNVALVNTQGEILQNKNLLIDALHTNAEGTAIYNQSVIDALSQFKNEVPASTPQTIAQVQKTGAIPTARGTVIEGDNIDEQIAGIPQVVYETKVDPNNPANWQTVNPKTGEVIASGTFAGGGDRGLLAAAAPVIGLAASTVGLPGITGLLGNLTGATGSTLAGLTGATIAGGTNALAGGNTQDILKAALLGGVAGYGGSEVGNYLKYQDVPIDFSSMTQDQINDALDVNFRNDLARAGLTDSQIKSYLANPSGVFDVNATTPTAVSTPVTDAGTVSVAAPTTTATTLPVITAPVTNAGSVNVTGTSSPQQIDQSVMSLINSQLAANVGTPANLANVQVTGDKGLMSNVDTNNAILNTLTGLTTPTSVTTPTQTITGQKPATTQDIVDAITSTLPSVTQAQASTVAEQIITSGKPVTTQEVISAITAALPTVTTPTTTTVPTQTITAEKPSSINDVITAATIPLIQPSTPLTPTPVTSTTDNTLGLTDAQIANLLKAGLGLFGTVGAASALSGGGTTVSPTGLPTQQPPMYTGDYFTKVQQNYNQLLPAVPRDVASPLRDWYLSQYGA